MPKMTMLKKSNKVKSLVVTVAVWIGPPIVSRASSKPNSTQSFFFVFVI